MKKQSSISLSKLAHMDNPFEDEQIAEITIQKLLCEKQEGRYLDWKLLLPIDKNISTSTKYRIVKAIISFANTDGGFVVCGVRNDGRWVGVSKENLSRIDSANIVELVNGCTAPEISPLNIHRMKHKGKYYLILHTPPSKSMPHVTSKPIYEQCQGGRRTILERYAVYCRYGAKSDLAKPTQFQRIVKKRTEYLENELLRRIKEVPLSKNAVIMPSKESPSSSQIVYYNKSNRGATQIVKVSNDRGKCDGILYHEELSPNLFDDVNKILQANEILSQNNKSFKFDLTIYYRVYAGRDKLEVSDETNKLLATTGLRLYAPCLFWFNFLSDRVFAEVLKEFVAVPKFPSIITALRISMLLGTNACDWIERKLKTTLTHDFMDDKVLNTFAKMKVLAERDDVRLAAIQQRRSKEYLLPDKTRIGFSELLRDNAKAIDYLTKFCQKVTMGSKNYRTICRLLDVLAFGTEIEKRGYKVTNFLLGR